MDLPFALATGVLGVSFGVLARSLGWGAVAPIAFSVITYFIRTQGKTGLFQKARLLSLSVQREGFTLVIKHVMAKLGQEKHDKEQRARYMGMNDKDKRP